MRRRLKKKLLYFAMSAIAASGCFAGGKAYLQTRATEVAKQVTSSVAESITDNFSSLDVFGNNNAEMTDAVETTVNHSASADSEFSTWNSAESIPSYTGQTYVELNGNKPYFTDEEKTTDIFENYPELDSLGRCGQAYANICKELMPTEERGNIGMIKPSGWHTVKYPDLIQDLYLYNRCHLIAFCLAGENANEKNLVTGTRYLNVTGMLPFETEVANYVDNTNNHVLYRVTPIFVADELVCRGVEMEAWSVEDNGEGICFHIFVYNEQPGITIDHQTGDSWES